MANQVVLSESGKLVGPDGQAVDITIDDITLDEVTLTKFGLGVTPVGVRSAYTQTYSTADRTVAAATAAALTDSTTGTTVTTLAAGVGVNTVSIPLTSLATGLSTAAIDLLTNYTPGYRFKVLGFSFVTTVAGTGSSASQVFNLEIDSTNVTGGVLTLALADTDTIGKVTNATAVSAANVGTAAQTLSIEMAASGTVFTAGAGYFLIKLQNMDTADAFAGLVTQHTALVADGLDNRQAINALVDDLQAFGLAG